MPTVVEILWKFLKLESETGFENRAVIGGLEKFLPTWNQGAAQLGIPQETIIRVAQLITEYGQISPQDRGQWINSLLAELQELKQTGSALALSEKPAEKFSTQHKPTQSSQQIQPNTQPPPQPGTLPREQTAIGLNAPLTVVRGVGGKSAEVYKTLGLRTLGDLLYYFPRRYVDYSQLAPIKQLRFGDEVTVIGTIKSKSARKVRGGQMEIIEAVLTDGSGYIRLTWFNRHYLLNTLPENEPVAVSGKVDMYLGRLVMNNPEWESLEHDQLHTNRIVPVYPLTAQLTQKTLRRTMYQAVNFWALRVEDHLPDYIRTDAGLINLQNAILQCHFPDSIDKLTAARQRLAFDEIFLLQLGVVRQKKTWQSGIATPYHVDDEWLHTLISSLPFELTSAQIKAFDQIRSDLSHDRPMNRLIQGDVGSGKTIIAALAIAIVVRNNAQAAFMAPTSILAEQHYRTLQATLSNSDSDAKFPLKKDEIRLLLGETPESEKKDIREGLASGRVKLVIGTHALIEDPITFQNLQLAIVDEQHRFGVAQRAALRSKGNNPHLLVMTATPIPRSLALTIYGDLDLSVIDESPAGRIPVDTYILSPREIERGYQLIRSQVDAGNQAFIIFPLVEKGENGDSKAAVNEYERLQKEEFPTYRLGLLHGRMKQEEKDAIMTSFRNGEFDILIATTVVEVGVDIPNATVMMIEGANRFGLSQLHQLRGRVGRSNKKSYCLLVAETDDATENERLKVMVDTNDGFILAEKDLEQRGPGEFLGKRQSGYSELKMANLTDIRLIEKARHFAQMVFEKDPDLTQPTHAALNRALSRFWGDGKGDIS